MSATAPLGAAEYQILVVLTALGSEGSWAKQIAQLLHRPPGGIIAPVAKLRSLGLVEETGTADLHDRRQIVRITPKGRFQLAACPVSILSDALEKPIEEFLRMMLVALHVFGPAAYALVGFAAAHKQRELREILRDSKSPPEGSDRSGELRDQLPGYRMFEDVAVNATRRKRIDELFLEETSLATLWSEIRHSVAEAEKLYQCCSREDTIPQEVLERERRSRGGEDTPF